jgi:hypothetical protein
MPPKGSLPASVRLGILVGVNEKGRGMNDLRTTRPPSGSARPGKNLTVHLRSELPLGLVPVALNLAEEYATVRVGLGESGDLVAECFDVEADESGDVPAGTEPARTVLLEALSREGA